MRKTKLTRSLLAACSIVALSAVMYGCAHDSGPSQGELDAALADKAAAEAAAAAAVKAAEDEAAAAAAAAAKAAEDEAAAAAAAAAKAAEEAEKAKQEAVAEAERKAADQAAAAEKMARATVQTNAINAAIMAAETALGMVVLGATDMDISDADMKLQAARDSIAAAVDVDDTSMYTAQVTGFEGRLMTAKGLVQQDRDAKKMARAEIQKGAIKSTTGTAEAAVALVVEGASNEVIADAEAAVQAARDAIAAAVDVDDTSMYTEAVDGFAGNLMTAKETVLADRLQDRIDLQKGAVSAAIQKAQSALADVVLGASDMAISDAEMAVQAAKDAIADAVDVEDTSMYTATVNGLESSLMTATKLVHDDRAAKKMARAVEQTANIKTAIMAAETALEMVDIEATDMEIAAAKAAVQAVKDAIAAAADVDDTSSYTAQITGIEGRLTTAEVAALKYRSLENIRLAGEQQDAIDTAVTAAEGAVDMVGPDADADDVAAADAKVKALVDAIADADNVDDTSASTTTLEGLQNVLSDRKTLRTAIMDAMEALGDLDNDSSDDDIEDVQDLIGDAEDAIEDAEHLSDDEKAAFTAKIDADDTGLQAMLDAEEKAIEIARTAGETRDAAEHKALDQEIMTEALPTLTAAALTPDNKGMPATTAKLTAASAPAAVGGEWTGNAYERTNAATSTTRASKDMVVIYNNKGLNENVRYDTHYDVDGNATAVGATDVDPDGTTGQLAFSNLGMAGMLLSPTGLGSQTAFDNDANNDVPGSFAGMFHGLAGTFECDATACTIQELAAGGYVTSGQWTFTPTTYSAVETERPKVSIPDPDFMHFGYWSNMQDDAKGNPVYEVEAFAGGTAASTATVVQNLTGLSATYDGEASGLYVSKTFTPDGTATPSASGQFTADASLKAYFGVSSNVAVNMQNRVSGTITGFEDAAGNLIDAKWSVDLMPGDFSSGENSAAAPFTGTTRPTGSTDDANGNWNYRFFGSMSENAATADITEAGVPTGVAGQFNGHFTNGHVLGAFGATSTGVASTD